MGTKVTDDVDWEHERIRITSSKTKRHVGKASRVIPLFPELRPYLDAAWDESEAGTEFVITRYREGNQNLRTQLERIIRRAGFSAWPKLFQNLRSTRETELTERFPIHVVCEWIGNSVPVAAKHYLQVTDDHYAEALRAEAAQNAAQQPHAEGRTHSHKFSQTSENADPCDEMLCGASEKIGPEGFEPPTKGL